MRDSTSDTKYKKCSRCNTLISPDRLHVCRDMPLTRRLRSHALPDPHDEREVLHAPLLKEAANRIDELESILSLLRSQVDIALDDRN